MDSKQSGALLGCCADVVFMIHFFTVILCHVVLHFPCGTNITFFFSLIVKTMLTCTGTHTNKNARTHTQVMEYVEEHKSCYAS